MPRKVCAVSTVGHDVMLENPNSWVITSAKYRQVAPYLAGLSRPASGQLNAALRWASADNKSFIFERPPARVKIEYHAKHRPNPGYGSVDCNEHWGPYEVWIPWTVYGVQFTSEKL